MVKARATTRRGRLACLILGALLCSLGAEASLQAQTEEDQLRYLERREFGWLPLVGGDSDFGYGAGLMLSLAGFEFPYTPYRYRLEAVALALFKVSPEHQLLVPYQDYTLRASFPQLFFDPLRVSLAARYVRSATLAFPGLGNGAQFDPTLDARQQRYALASAKLSLGLGIQLPEPWRLSFKVAYGRDFINYPAGGSVAQALASDSAWIRKQMAGSETHDVLLLNYVLGIDTRDHETAPSSGQFHELLVTHAPPIGKLAPLGWLRVNLNSRVYLSLYQDKVVLAGRAVLDLLFGNAPFYELARVDQKWALGSAFGVRGVPGQRYYGRNKLLGNLELRTEIARFKAFKRRLRVGFVAFGDLGRVFASLEPRSDLPKGGAPIHYGVGGGLRLQQGSVFVVRADLAWSPEADPIGFYFTAGHLF